MSGNDLDVPEVPGGFRDVYFSLCLEQATLPLIDPHFAAHNIDRIGVAATPNVPTPTDPTFLIVELECHPFDDAGFGEDDDRPIVTLNGQWQVGLKSDSRLYGKVLSQGQVYEVCSKEPVETGDKMTINYTAKLQAGQAPEGKIHLGNVDCSDTTLKLVSTVIGGGQSNSLQLGDLMYSGRIQQIVISKTPKDSFLNGTPIDKACSLPNLASVAVAFFHPTQALNCTSLCHVCVTFRDKSGAVDMATFTLPDAPPQGTLEIQALCSARSFSRDAWIDCGSCRLPSKAGGTFVFEIWFMLGLPHQGVPNEDGTYTLWSMGNMKELEGDGLGKGWAVDIKATKNPNSARPNLELASRTSIRTDQSRHPLRLAAAINPRIIGRWTLLTMTFYQYKIRFCAINNVTVVLQSPDGKEDLPSDRYKQNFAQSPLILGAACDRLHREVDGSYDFERAETSNHWLGYIKDFRLWNKKMTMDEVQKRYTERFEPTDENRGLFLWADLAVGNPQKVVLMSEGEGSEEGTVKARNEEEPEQQDEVRISPQSACDHAIPVVLPIATLTQPHYVAMVQAHFESFATPIDFDLSGADLAPIVELARDIIVIVFTRLTGAKVDMGKLVKLMKWVVGPKSRQGAAPRINRLTEANKSTLRRPGDSSAIGDVAWAAVEWIYDFVKQGVLKPILKCFSFGWSTVVKMLTRFIPYVGVAKLIVDLIQVVPVIVEGVNRYVKAIQQSPEPLALLLSVNDQTMVEKLFFRRPRTLSTRLNRSPLTSEVLFVALQSDPVGALLIEPARFELKEGQTEQLVTVTASPAVSAGQASLETESGTELLTFETAAPDTLELSPAIIEYDLKINDADVYELEMSFDLIWEGELTEDDVRPPKCYLVTQDGLVIEELDVTVSSQSTVQSTKGASGVYRVSNSKTVIARGKAKAAAAAMSTAPVFIQAVHQKTGTKTRTDTKQKKRKPIKEITIYMFNASHGDSFWIHIKFTKPNNDPKKNDEVTVKTMLIDGGPGRSIATAILESIDAAHLPPVPADGSPPQRKIDLVVCTHQDQDHNGGLLEVFTMMQANTFHSTHPHTELIVPGLVWINNPFGNKRNAASGISSIAVNDSSDDDPVNERDKRSAAGARQILRILRNEKWPDVQPPLQGGDERAQRAQVSFAKAETLLLCNGPTAEQVNAATSRPNNVNYNRSSFIFELGDAVGPDARFSSLWTGDAHDTFGENSTSSAFVHDIRNAIGVKPGNSKHYTVLKVGHHGSQRSNGAGFFADVTADHYLISCNGTHGNPRRECLQWICDGHERLRKKTGRSTLPTLWLANPLHFDGSTDLHLKGAIIKQRVPSEAGVPDMSRKSVGGFIRFKFIEGQLADSPIELAVGATNGNTLPNRVVKYESVASTAKRSIIRDHEPWIYPIASPMTAIQKMLPEEAAELQQVAPAFHRGLIVSESWGSFDPGLATDMIVAQYSSDWDRVVNQSIDQMRLPKVIECYYLEGVQAHSSHVQLFQVYSDPGINSQPPSNQSRSVRVVLGDGEFITAVDLYGNEAIGLITGVTVFTSRRREILVRSADQMVVHLAQPSWAHVLIGTRQRNLRIKFWPPIDDVPLNPYLWPCFLQRLGLIWVNHLDLPPFLGTATLSKNKNLVYVDAARDPNWRTGAILQAKHRGEDDFRKLTEARSPDSALHSDGPVRVVQVEIKDLPDTVEEIRAEVYSIPYGTEDRVQGSHSMILPARIKAVPPPSVTDIRPDFSKNSILATLIPPSDGSKHSFHFSISSPTGVEILEATFYDITQRSQVSAYWPRWPTKYEVGTIQFRYDKLPDDAIGLCTPPTPFAFKEPPAAPVLSFDEDFTYVEKDTGNVLVRLKGIHSDAKIHHRFTGSSGAIPDDAMKFGWEWDGKLQVWRGRGSKRRNSDPTVTGIAIAFSDKGSLLASHYTDIHLIAPRTVGDIRIGLNQIPASYPRPTGLAIFFLDRPEGITSFEAAVYDIPQNHDRSHPVIVKANKTFDFDPTKTFYEIDPCRGDGPSALVVVVLKRGSWENLRTSEARMVWVDRHPIDPGMSDPEED